MCRRMLLTWVMLIELLIGLLLLLQGIVRRYYTLSFRKGWSSVSYAEGDTKGSTEAPFLSI